MTKAFTDAVDAAGLTNPMESYCTFENGMLVELRCRVCATPIAKLIPHDRPKIVRQGVQTFITERMVFGYLPNYREVLLTMDDGSQHVTNCCADHVDTFRDPVTAAASYAKDLTQWSSEGMWLDDAICARKPLAFVRSDIYIRDRPVPSGVGPK